MAFRKKQTFTNQTKSIRLIYCFFQQLMLMAKVLGLAVARASRLTHTSVPGSQSQKANQKLDSPRPHICQELHVIINYHQCQTKVKSLGLLIQQTHIYIYIFSEIVFCLSTSQCGKIHNQTYCETQNVREKQHTHTLFPSILENESVTMKYR